MKKLEKDKMNSNSQGTKVSRRKLLQSLGVVGAAMAIGSVGSAIVQGKPIATSSVTDNVYGTDPEPLLDDCIFNVKLYGAVGDGVVDDTSIFEQCLTKVNEHGRGTIVVPPGTYKLTRVLRLYRNTMILMDDGAVLKRMGNPDVHLKLFINGVSGDADYAFSYEGDGNLTLIGGTMDLCGDTNPPSSSAKNFQALALAHADRIYMERVQFVNGYNGHIIEFNSSRNVTLRNCSFKNQLVKGTDQYEMVQIDFADSLSFPLFGAYDNTPCRDVLIEGCTFENGHRGVGTHGSKYDSAGQQVFHENIRIVNNHFKGLKDIAIKPESYRNAIVSGNTIEQSGGNAISVYSCSNLVISDNVIRQTGLHGIAITRKTVAGGFDEPSVLIQVADNVISNVKNSAFRIIGGSGVVVTGNYCSAIQREGVYVTNTKDAVIKGNVFRGVTQDQNALYYGLRIEGCSGVEVSENTLTNQGFTNNYKYAVFVPAGNTGVNINLNTLSPGVSGTLYNDAVDTLFSTAQGERLLTEVLNTTSGTVTLNDDITKYRSVIVATGSVTDETLRHEIARGWITTGFRPGTDIIHVLTSNGQFVAKIEASNQILIVSASDPLRYIIGVS
ncbi:right-handed parallel beta-helix repeat-containing protein [Paenibacillus sp. UNC451MF]|uniref:right-handed parallel beta-helix repeat-containing protein n=1 Tax=Paenibacillus sp. UNC451MF TaxID=1449063 RepID=UPI00048BED8B|nr:right-handed parallel beta-helix repeat-containing protein [Paenibacillus sp. UNC451MF]